MELLPILRQFWRRRLRLGAGVFVAIGVLVALGGTRVVTSRVAVAWTSVVLDTPKSQLVDVAPLGADTLPWRASLLAHLMATESSKQEIARRLGVSRDEVIAVDPEFAQPWVRTDMATAATKAAASAAGLFVVTAGVPNITIPMISLEAAAPTTPAAQRLAEAAVAVLQSQASSAGRFTSQVITNAGNLQRQAFEVTQVTPLHAKVIASSSIGLKAIGASMFVFILWSTAVLLLPPRTRSIRRGRRAVAV